MERQLMIVKNISALVDNYIWILYDIHRFCIIIDPGLSDPVMQEIEKKKLYPIAILLTHYHVDHTSGVKNLIKYYPNMNIFGPRETEKNYVNKVVKSGDKLILLNKTFSVFYTPGHTLGHVSYYSKPYIFCGDTLFSGGCGRVYNEKYLDMYHSIKMISFLPNYTMLCCAHEYTLSNLSFSMFLLPHDNNIKNYYEKIQNLIRLGKSSLPSYIFFEKKINLFLRTNERYLKERMGLKKNATSFETFKKLRIKKDVFGAKRD